MYECLCEITKGTELNTKVHISQVFFVGISINIEKTLRIERFAQNDNLKIEKQYSKQYQKNN